MGKLIIMRGLPGSGKTHHVKELLARHNGEVVVASADHFFEYVELNATCYKFDPSRIGEAHEACKIKVVKAMQRNVPLIIVDNTNTQRWEYELYLELAKLAGYEAEVREIEVRDRGLLKLIDRRQQHGVPFANLLQMWRRWEPCSQAKKLEVV